MLRFACAVGTVRKFVCERTIKTVQTKNDDTDVPTTAINQVVMLQSLALVEPLSAHVAPQSDMVKPSLVCERVTRCDGDDEKIMLCVCYMMNVRTKRITSRIGNPELNKSCCLQQVFSTRMLGRLYA